MAATTFYNTQIARVGEVIPGGPPNITNVGVPPLADANGRFIVVVDDTANVRVVETSRYPAKFGFINPSNEGLLGISANMHALTRVWGSNASGTMLFFHIRLVDSGSSFGIIPVTIPVPPNYGTFSQELYLPFEVDGNMFDTMYYDLSTTPDAINPSPTPDLRLNFNYLGAQPVTTL